MIDKIRGFEQEIYICWWDTFERRRRREDPWRVLGFIYEIRTKKKERKKDRTRGHEKLSLGKTASYSRTHSLIRLSSSRNAYRFWGSSSSSALSISSSESVLSTDLLNYNSDLAFGNCILANQRIFWAFRDKNPVCIEVVSKIVWQRSDDGAFDAMVSKGRIPWRELKGKYVGRTQCGEEAWSRHRQEFKWQEFKFCITRWSTIFRPHTWSENLLNRER